MKRKTISLILAALFLLGVFSPLGHLLHEDHHDEVTVCQNELSESCGGDLDPCSRQDHDHSSETPSSHDCLLCQSSQFAPIIESSKNILSLSLAVLERSQSVDNVVLFSRNIFSLGSRAPPVCS